MRCFIVILLVSMFFGCPGKGQHSRKITSKIVSYSNFDDKYFTKGIETIIENSVIHKDYILFSICTYKTKIISVGALNLIWVNDLAILKTLKI